MRSSPARKRKRSKFEGEKVTTTESRLPHHVAIIMDGNGRWARKRQLPQIEGHRAGVENLRVIIKYCAETRIDALTLFAFSSENWCRPPMEVKLLFDLFVVALEQEIEHLHEADVRLRIIGDVAPFPGEARTLHQRGASQDA